MLISKAEQLIINQRIKSNIDKTIKTINYCLKVLDEFGFIKELMIDQNYYKAVKLLSQLENKDLPSLSQFTFVLTAWRKRRLPQCWTARHSLIETLTLLVYCWLPWLPFTLILLE